ncbi:hypothetical protein VTO42DRAFT_876 [Malbranchea cinnamomea]
MFSRSAFRLLSSPSSLANSSLLAATRTSVGLTTRRACLHSSSSGDQFRATPSEIPPQTQPTAQASQQQSQQQQQHHNHQPPESSKPTIPRSKLPVPPIFTSPLTISPSVASLLPYLVSQPKHYVTAHLHARPYLITPGDTIRLPYLMPDVEPGDVIRLNRVSALGSRDFTLKGTPYLDERLFECRVRVIGTESEPLRIKEKTKRRNRHVRRVKSKHRYTVLRVMEIKIKSLDELLAEGAQIAKE